jgi:hypothetical protein
MTELGKTPERERKFLTIRCPACSGEVTVATEYKKAKCRCGHKWEWREKGIRVTLATGDRRAHPRMNPDALEIT